VRYAAVGLLFLAASLAGCGDAAPPPRAPPPAAAIAHPVSTPWLIRPTAAVDRIMPTEEGPSPSPTPPVAVVGSLERPAALEHFFEALARLDDGHAHEDVRIVQFGDSHTAADFETGPMRRALQARFGDGGRGFVQIGKPWKWYVQEGLHVVGMSGWSAARSKPSRTVAATDGQYGLLGVSIESSKRGARAWTAVAAPTSKLELAFLEQPNGGSLDLFVDGARTARINTRAKEMTSGYQSIELADEPHQIEIQALGDGAVRVFGMTLDRAQVGLTLDALGINGARVGNLLAWSEPHMAEQLRHRAPDLVVLAYGTNETSDDTPISTYERQLVDVLGRVARAVPSASCLLLGPPDRAILVDGEWVTIPRLYDIVAAQRRIAEAARCAYYSQLDAMGGPGSIATWALEEKPRALGDRVHLSRVGYTQLGVEVAGDVIRAYAAWRADRGLPPAQGPAPSPPTPLPPLPKDEPKNQPVAQALATP
jgi:lysophospholipase L1-like esterase